MPKRAGETQRQYMDRLRAVRGLPPMTDETDFRAEIMGRTRAAVAFIDGTSRSPESHERLKLHAFMSIFHPEEPAERTRELIRAQRRPI